MDKARKTSDGNKKNIDSGTSTFRGDNSAAMEKFGKYVDFWVKVKPSVTDKIMFCLYKGMESPRELMQKLIIAKGNLANYCKQMCADSMITKQVSGRIVKYGLTKKGEARVKKILEAMNDFI